MKGFFLYIDLYDVYVFETGKLRHGKWHKKSSPEKKNHIERNWKLENIFFLSYQDNTRDELPYIEKRKEKRKGKRKRK